jgi:hypothetical protein
MIYIVFVVGLGELCMDFGDDGRKYSKRKYTTGDGDLS